MFTCIKYFIFWSDKNISRFEHIYRTLIIEVLHVKCKRMLRINRVQTLNAHPLFLSCFFWLKISFCFMYVSEFLSEKGKDTSFEELPVDQLSSTLREFYGSLRTKDGTFYSRSAYVNIRSGLNRHLNSRLFHRQLNLMRDLSFLNANQVFTSSDVPGGKRCYST